MSLVSCLKGLDVQDATQLSTHDVFALVSSGWPQIMALAGVIWWARRIDLRSKDHGKAIEKHAARIDAAEVVQQSQRVSLARIDEALSGIKLTCDRIYTEVHKRE